MAWCLQEQRDELSQKSNMIIKMQLLNTIKKNGNSIKNQTQKLNLGIVKIWGTGGDLVVLNINSESKLTLVVHIFSVFQGAQSLKLRLTTDSRI